MTGCIVGWAHSKFGKHEGVELETLIVEAATEDRDLKRRIFSQVEGLVSEDAVLVSNSSHLEPYS